MMQANPQQPPSLDQQANPQGLSEARRQKEWAYDTFEGCLRPALAEFLASLIFVYIAVGTGVTTGQYNNPTWPASTGVGPAILMVAISFGFTMFILSWMIGHISGGHINPIITMVFMGLRKMSFLRGCMYLIAQAAGYLCGAGLVRATTPDTWTMADGSTASNCLASTMVNSELSPGHAILIEIIMTGFLMMVVCAATDSFKSNQIMVPLSIGLVYTVCLLFSITLDGGSLNPFRSFASAAVADTSAGCRPWANHWVYWVGPIVGGFLGGAIYEFLLFDGGIRTFGVPQPGDFTRYDLVKSYRLTPYYDMTAMKTVPQYRIAAVTVDHGHDGPHHGVDMTRQGNVAGSGGVTEAPRQSTSAV